MKRAGLKHSLFCLAVLVFLKGQAPNRPYTLLSPLSSVKGSLDKANSSLLKKANKLKADAIVDLDCSMQQTPTGLLTIVGVCTGYAVRWAD